MSAPVTHLSMHAWADLLGATGSQRLRFLPQMAACCDGRELDSDETVGAVNVGYALPTCAEALRIMSCRCSFRVESVPLVEVKP